MPRLVIAPLAAEDVESILEWSRRTFGSAARQRYESLLAQAFEDIAEDPMRLGVAIRDDLRRGMRIYRLYFSRNRARSEFGVVRQPRHVIAFRIRSDGVVEVVRALHEHMDFDLHLPPDKDG